MSLTEVAHANFYLHQTSGKCAGKWKCSHMHQMDVESNFELNHCVVTIST